MSRIVIFGAGGRAGHHAVAEAASRGHEVIAVVRDPATHPELARAGAGVTVVAGDVTEADSVATVATGADAAVNAAARLDMSSVDFFEGAARALLDGLGRTGTARLVQIGIGSTLEVAPGVAVHDTPDFPAEGRTFSLGHSAGLDVWRQADTDIDWLVVAPPPTLLDDEALPTRRYQIGGHQVLPSPEGAPMFAYADLAVAVLDQIDSPTHHRDLVAVGATAEPT